MNIPTLYCCADLTLADSFFQFQFEDKICFRAFSMESHKFKGIYFVVADFGISLRDR